jgi:hypothetical protein
VIANRLGYKSLMEVERGLRYFRHVSDIRPVYHPKEDRVRPLCCCAGRVKDSGGHVRDELRALHGGFFSTPAGRVTQRTELTSGKRANVKALGLKEPPRFLGITAAKGREGTTRAPPPKRRLPCSLCEFRPLVSCLQTAEFEARIRRPSHGFLRSRKRGADVPTHAGVSQIPERGLC